MVAILVPNTPFMLANLANYDPVVAMSTNLEGSTALLKIDPTSGLRRLGTAELRDSFSGVISSLTESILVVNRSTPKAVLVPYEKYVELMAIKKADHPLDFLTDTYRQLAAASNTPAAQAAADEAFNATPEEFGRRPLK